MSEPGEGPVLAGINVTVFPGKSSRSLAGVAAVLAGWATWGVATMGAGTHTSATLTLGSRLERGARASREGRAIRCWTWGRCISIGEAIST